MRSTTNAEITTAFWEQAYQAGKEVQMKAGGRLDENGLEVWQELSKNLSDNPESSGLEWDTQGLKNIWDSVLETSSEEVVETILGDMSNVACWHFLRQTIRIPIEYKPTQKRVVQVAYNLGQLVGSGALDDNAADGTKLSDFKRIEDFLEIEDWTVEKK